MLHTVKTLIKVRLPVIHHERLVSCNMAGPNSTIIIIIIIIIIIDIINKIMIMIIIIMIVGFSLI